MKIETKLTRLFPGGLGSRLSLKLMVFVVICSLFFTLLASAFQLFTGFRQDVESIKRNFKFIEDSTLPFIAKTAYNVDEEQLELQLKGLLQLQDIEYLEMDNVAIGNDVAVGNRNAKRDLVGTFHIVHEISMDHIIDLGKLTVVASYDGIYQRLWGNASIILISTMIQVFLVAFFTLLIMQYLIVRHLLNMAHYAETLNIDTLHTTLELNRKPKKNANPDELDLVVQSVNDLQSRIKKDVIALNQVESALRENERKLFAEKQFSDTLINTLPVIFFLYENGQRLVRWNRVHVSVTGYSEHELLGKEVEDFFKGDDLKTIKTTIKQVLEGGSGTIEARLNLKNGDSMPYLFSANLLVQDDTRYIIGIGVDISALKSAEKALHLTKYSIDNSSIAAYWIKEDGRIHYANKAATTFSGYSSKELNSFQLGKLIPQFRSESFNDHWLKLKKKRSLSFEEIQVNHNGSRIPVEINTSFQEFEGEEYIFAYIQDISERKKAEVEKNRLVSVIEQSNDSILITDLKGSIDYVNPAFEQMTGYSKNEVLQKNPRMMKSGRHDKAFYKEIWETITSKKTWIGRIINKRKDGKIIQESATIFPITNSNGDITNYAAVNRDITEQLRLELQLQQTQKLEAIGTLAGGIAHDFNNILTAIYGYTRLAQKKLLEKMDPALMNKYLENIQSAGIRAEGLVSQILTFSRKAGFEPDTIDLQPLLKESIKFLQASLPATISISHSIDSNLNRVYGDYTQIHQIIMNLSTNASHAMEKTGGELEIKLSNVEITHQSPDTCNLTPGNYVLLYVGDTGIGMEESVQRRIFEPFFTTKEKDKGTGLGLSVVHGIVKNHRGGIQVHSQTNKGTKFSIYLPASEDSTAVQKTNSVNQLPAGTESILLVDDESDIAFSYGEMLKMQGYKVKVVTDSTEAYMEFGRQGNNYDLVITDYTMPGMDGIKLSQKILNLKPSTSIVMISGLGELISNEEIIAAGIKKRFSKPVEFEQLAVSIRSILDQ